MVFAVFVPCFSQLERRYFTVRILSLLDSGQTYAGQRKFVLRKQFSVYCEKTLVRELLLQVRQFILGRRPATLSRPLRRGILAGWRNYDLSFQQGFFFQRAAVGRLRLRFLPYGVSRDGGEPQCECELLVALPAGVVCTHLRV